MKAKNNKYADILSKVNNNQRGVSDSILIVDGLNTFLRSFTMINHINPDGAHIGGLTGFLKSIGYAIRTIDPTKVVIVFDGVGGSNARRNLFPDYKANRNKNRITNYSIFQSKDEETESINNQMERLIQYLKCLPVTVISIDGLEADDIIGYLANKFEKFSLTEEVTIMSADQDFLQLVNKDVSVYSPTKKKIYTPDVVLEEFGIHPHNFINFRMIDGDKSDSIEGINGLGIKSIIKAFPILAEETYHTTESMLEYAKNVDKRVKAHELFENGLAICERNRRLMQLAEPEFSGNLRMKIMDRYDEPTPKFDKQGFLKTGLRHGVIDAFKDINDWLQSTFGHISKF